MIQTKLTIGQPGDTYEQEADQIADQVMRMPEPKERVGSMVGRRQLGTIQRVCSKCEEEVRRQPVEEEDKEKKLRRQVEEEDEEEALRTKPLAAQISSLIQRRVETSGKEEEGTLLRKFDSDQSRLRTVANERPVQTKELPGQTLEIAAGIESRANSLNGNGHPLDAETRHFFEPRFGWDFSGVRVHTDNNSAEAAKMVNAQAFTVGNNIVFGSGGYRPQANEGKRLLGHELTHVVQQQEGRSNANTLRRKINVLPGATQVQEILSQFNFLCPTVAWGNSANMITGTCTSSSTRSCDCLCDTVNDSSRTYTITVGAVSNSPATVVLHNGITASVPMPSHGPHTVNGSNPSIVMHSSVGNAIGFDAFDSSGNEILAGNWRILAHELCGHARLNQSYAGNKGNRPGHDVTIDTENAIAAEHGGKARGHFSDTRQGESFHYQVGPTTHVVFRLVNGWHYEAP